MRQTVEKPSESLKGTISNFQTYPAVKRAAGELAFPLYQLVKTFFGKLRPRIYAWPAIEKACFARSAVIVCG